MGTNARLGALRAQQAYLESHRADWRALAARGDQRLDARLITAVERHQLRQLTETVERKAEIVRGETERLAAHAVKAPPPPRSLASAAPSPADALADQLRPVRYARPTRLELAARERRDSLAQARRELTVVERELSFADSTGRLLERAGGAPGTAHARDMLTLERIITESERVYLRALVAGLAASLEDPQGS